MKELDWANLPFGYMKTDYNVRIYYRNEQWGELEVCSEETIPMHMAATCLHYGQEAFEGLKAFRGKDGKVRIFRLEENAARLQSTCRGILMPELSTERFKEAILKVVKLNERFIPPYESGASLYIRPLLIGTGGTGGGASLWQRWAQSCSRKLLAYHIALVAGHGMKLLQAATGCRRAAETTSRLLFNFHLRVFGQNNQQPCILHSR